MPPTTRLHFLDFARGIALVLIVLIHSFRNIVDTSTITHYALFAIPSLFRLFSQAGHGLFMLIFGFLIGYVYITKAKQTQFSQVVLKFWSRALLIFLAYRACAFFEFYGLGREFHLINISDAGWSNILLFYSLACLVVPFILSAWQRVPILTFYLAIPLLYLLYSVGFMLDVPESVTNLKAAITGQEAYYVFPLIPYLSVVIAGMLGGYYFKKYYAYHKTYFAYITLALAGCTGAVLAIAFSGDYVQNLVDMRNHVYRNPVHVYSLLYTVTLALPLLALAHARQFIFHKTKGAIEYLGRHTLAAFMAHIFLIFIPTNYLLGGLRGEDTMTGIMGSLLILAVTIAYVMVWERISVKLRPISGR